MYVMKVTDKHFRVYYYIRESLKHSGMLRESSLGKYQVEGIIHFLAIFIK